MSSLIHVFNLHKASASNQRLDYWVKGYLVGCCIGILIERDVFYTVFEAMLVAFFKGRSLSSLKG